MTLKRYIAVLIAIVAVSMLGRAQSAFTAKQPKTTICHKTKSAKKPYVKLKVGQVNTRRGPPAPRGRHHSGTDRTVSHRRADSGRRRDAFVHESPRQLTRCRVPATQTERERLRVRLRQGEGRVCFKIAVYQHRAARRPVHTSTWVL